MAVKRAATTTRRAATKVVKTVATRAAMRVVQVQTAVMRAVQTVVTRAATDLCTTPSQRRLKAESVL